MSNRSTLGGTFTFPATSLTVHRMGYGAMQLAGPGVWGPPKDPDNSVAVLRAAVDAGVNHIDTADFYGPHVVNQLVRTALHPYPAGLTIVTKVGAKRGPDKSWLGAASAAELTTQVQDNLRTLGLDVLDVVNFRVFGHHFPVDVPVAEPMATLADLQRKGLIRHLGLSHASAAQVAEARRIAPVVCVQNQYNVVNRGDDALVDELAAAGIPYVPWFPLGGFTPLQSQVLTDVAASVGATVMQVALAWLLQRSPNVLLIPGTSSVAHLRENLAAADLTLPAEAVAKLNGLGSATTQHTGDAHTRHATAAGA